MTQPDEAVQAAQARYAEQVGLAALTSQVALGAWAELDLANIARSWLALMLRQVLPAMAAAQLTAANGAEPYLDRVLDALDRRAEARRRRRRRPERRLEPRRLAGVAADGRPLPTLLYRPAVTTLQAIDRGATPRQAAAVGGTQLDMIVRTEVADAGRVATGVEIVATSGMGYVRMVNPPACSRCIILAGKFYRWNAGFQRHPRCDCIHIPANEDTADDLRTDPRRYFDSLSEAEQDRIFTRAGARAIRDGADIFRVVNARRGMATTGQSETRVREDGLVVNVRHRTQASVRVHGRDVFATTEGVRRRSRAIRLMPEQIYADAAGSRDEAIRLLRLHGYLT